MIEFKYVIFEKSEYSKLDISSLLVFSAEPIRMSTDNIHAYAKYTGEMPSTVFSLTTKSTEYTREQMNEYFSKENWDKTLPGF
jgi:hypothetical protein